jgi:hypothetical protein
LIPVKTYTGNLILNSIGLNQSREAFGNSFQNAFLSLFQLDIFPVFDHLVCIFHIGFTIDVWMSVDQFIGDLIRNIGHIKSLFFTAYFGIKNNVKEKIPKLLFDFLQIIVQNGISQFIGLLYGQMAKGLKSLFAIPGTFFPKFIHNIKQTLESLKLCCSRSHLHFLRIGRFILLWQVKF